MLLTAPISNISRTSFHDGPGIRSVVYFMGCNMRCKWCHNPENLTSGRKILSAPVKCVHCGRCIAVCPEHHKILGDDHVYVREGCIACGRCADACPSNALTVCGTDRTVSEVLKAVLKDRMYYRTSGGGVTLSGGECLLYPEFARQLLEALRNEHIHTAIETALYVPWQNAESVIDCADLVYADLKLSDPEKHKVYTGVSNERIIDNLRRLTGRHGNVIIRIPLIPGVNDSADDMACFAAVLGTMGEGLKAVELLKYNSLAESKYSMSGMAYTRFGEGPQADEAVDALRNRLDEALRAGAVRLVEVL